MKTWLKFLITIVVGLAIMWVCYQVFHFESVMTSAVSVVVTLMTYIVCDNIQKRTGKK